MVEWCQVDRSSYVFFCKYTATAEIYTLSLHDALPIWRGARGPAGRRVVPAGRARRGGPRGRHRDRKSTRLNSSHQIISYAVFCLKKKKRFPMWKNLDTVKD